MNLNLTDPESIVHWWRSFPERHWVQLDFLEEARPQFGEAIRVARQLIEGDRRFNRSRIQAFAEAMQAVPICADGDVLEVGGEVGNLH